MANVDKVLEIFMDGNYFIIFLLLIVIVLIVLVLCLIKSREEYNELLRSTEREDYLDNSIANENTQSKEMDVFESMKEDEIDIFADFDSLKATSEEDMFDEEKPLIKQIDIPKIKTYDDIINEYETNEEECAVISASQLDKVKQERMNELGVSDNRQVIERYEEEQENKAIISYEQLLKNAPECLSPRKVSQLTPIAKNKVYELIKTGELESFIYQGKYIIIKEDLINYMCEHCSDDAGYTYKIKK
jgi:hypothetical protein